MRLVPTVTGLGLTDDRVGVVVVPVTRTAVLAPTDVPLPANAWVVVMTAPAVAAAAADVPARATAMSGRKATRRELPG